MTDGTDGQVSRSAAEVYDEFFVPALFHEWAAPVADASGVGRGQQALDVACGTGVVARELARRVAPGGRVIGLDCNDGMLAVAARNAPSIEWREGHAEALPFADESFDAAACQFGLMFFDDRTAALSEMWRVLRPGGRLAVAVWDSLDNSPGYDAMVDLLDRLFGKPAGDALRAPFCLGDRDALRALSRDAGIDNIEIATRTGTARFPSLDEWVHINIRGWTLADMIDDAQFEELRCAVRAEFQSFVDGDGSVILPAPAHIVTATRH